jgi:hypothetical protein
MNMLATLLSSYPLSSILLDSVDEFLSALGMLDMLDANVHTFLNVAISDTFVYNDTKGGLRNVVDNTGLSVVYFVRHTLLDGTVCLNIYNIAYTILILISGNHSEHGCLENVLVLFQINRHGNHALLTMIPREGISRPRSNTARVTHC